VLTPLKVKFLGEVINRLFEAHIETKSVEGYKPSVESSKNGIARLRSTVWSLSILVFESQCSLDELAAPDVWDNTLFSNASE
jgi:hypothetical protein